jgi:DNA-binding NtrC family response regulator
MTDFSAQRDQADLHGSRLTALVIEADVILQQFLRRLLERHGIETRLAFTMEQGARLSREDNAIDVVLHASRSEPEDGLAFGGSRAPLPVVTFGGVMSLRVKGPRRAGSSGRADTGEIPLDAEVLVQSILSAVRRETPRKAPGRAAPEPASLEAPRDADTQPIRRSS